MLRIFFLSLNNRKKSNPDQLHHLSTGNSRKDQSNYLVQHQTEVKLKLLRKQMKLSLRVRQKKTTRLLYDKKNPRIMSIHMDAPLDSQLMIYHTWKNSTNVSIGFLLAMKRLSELAMMYVFFFSPSQTISFLSICLLSYFFDLHTSYSLF